MIIRDAIDRYHASVDQFSRGDSAPAKEIFSRKDDVTLANPWGPAVRGWSKVSEALDAAASKFKEGKVTGIDVVARYEDQYLATILTLEHWRSKVAGRNEISAFDLRVTTIFRRENDGWKVVHRHADSITTANAEGPLRRS